MMGKIKKQAKSERSHSGPPLSSFLARSYTALWIKMDFMPWQTLPILGCWSILGGLTVLQASSVLPQLPSHTFLP